MDLREHANKIRSIAQDAEKEKTELKNKVESCDVRQNAFISIECTLFSDKRRLLLDMFKNNKHVKAKEVTADFLYELFGECFRFNWDPSTGELLKEEPLISFDLKGEQLFSLEKPGCYASPEEAIELLMNEVTRNNNTN